MIYIKSSAEIELMREAGRIAAKAHEAVNKHIKVGMTTWELDKIIEKVIRANGADASFKGYNGFPAAACISINDEVIHGIPSKARKLKSGDIVGVDIGARYHGFHGDTAATYGVGELSDEAQRLIDVTKSAFYAGADAARRGNHVGDISKAVQQVATDAGFSIVRDFVGHGVGSELHESPEIPNYFNGKRGARLERGMTIAIEPMINVGENEIRQLSDGWTIVTVDSSLSAHYEHTVLITDGEPEILTRLK